MESPHRSACSLRMQFAIRVNSQLFSICPLQTPHTTASSDVSNSTERSLSSGSSLKHRATLAKGRLAMTPLSGADFSMATHSQDAHLYPNGTEKMFLHAAHDWIIGDFIDLCCERCAFNFLKRLLSCCLAMPVKSGLLIAASSAVDAYVRNASFPSSFRVISIIVRIVPPMRPLHPAWMRNGMCLSAASRVVLLPSQCEARQHILSTCRISSLCGPVCSEEQFRCLGTQAYQMELQVSIEPLTIVLLVLC